MARARSSGAAAVWGMVLFGVAFAVCLILAIVSYTQTTKLKDQATSAQKKLRNFVKPDEEIAPAVVNLKRQGKTVVGYLLGENDQLKRMVTGEAKQSAEEVAQQKKSQGIELALFREIERLNGSLSAAEETVAAAGLDRDKARQRAKDAQVQMDELRRDFDSAQKGLNDQRDKLRREFEGYTGKGDRMVQDLNSRFESLRAEKDEQIVRLKDQLDQLSRELKEAQRKILELTRGPAGDPTFQNLTTSDGQIAAVVPDQNKVYINRGQDDHVLLGTTFEIFDEQALVKLEDVEQGRGKATIEVIDVDRDTAVARVVRKNRRAVIDEGDQIINLVYDPNAVYKFHVHGQFDIDRLGLPSIRDRKRIEGMIARWNGIMTEQLTYDVDFLVLGREPTLPEALDRGEIDPVTIADQVAQQEAYRVYQFLVSEARKLSIPILNQNRFLALVGYYQR